MVNGESYSFYGRSLQCECFEVRFYSILKKKKKEKLILGTFQTNKWIHKRAKSVMLCSLVNKNKAIPHMVLKESNMKKVNFAPLIVRFLTQTGRFPQMLFLRVWQKDFHAWRWTGGKARVMLILRKHADLANEGHLGTQCEQKCSMGYGSHGHSASFSQQESNECLETNTRRKRDR